MAPNLILLSLSLLAGCTGEEQPAEQPEAQPAEQPAEQAVTPDVQFEPETLKAEAENVTLVPSPAEMQRALANAGLTSELASMVSDKDIGTDVENLDQVAVRTGVILAEGYDLHGVNGLDRGTSALICRGGWHEVDSKRGSRRACSGC